MSKIRAKQKGLDLRHSVRYPHWRNDRSEWTIVEGAYESIVTKELWEKANSMNRHQSGPRCYGYKHKSPYLLTGLIRCSRCGFAFQGWSGTVDGKKYYRYIDGGYQSKRVCEYLGIRREKLETFALQAIRETLTDPSLEGHIENLVQALLEGPPSFGVADELERTLQRNEKSIRNITQAIERGGNLESLLGRLEELEKERRTLEARLGELDVESSCRLDPDEVSSQVANFVLNFETEFEKAPIEEKKILVRRCISQIIIDRDKNVVRFYIRRIPAVVPQLEASLQNKGVPTGLVSTPSSGGGT